MSEKSWASLAALLDDRRTVESLVAGIKIRAHPDFRCAVTMNDDASTYEVPDYIISRLQPMIEIDFPDREEELAILRYNIDFAPETVLALTVDFLQRSHEHDLHYSSRDGINIIRYALKLKESHDLEIEEAFRRSTLQVLGKDAFDFENKGLRGSVPLHGNLVGLDEFFTHAAELLALRQELEDTDFPDDDDLSDEYERSEYNFDFDDDEDEDEDEDEDDLDSLGDEV